MSIWIEALLGLAAVVLCTAACWREEKLVEWEDRLAARARQRKKEGYYGTRTNATGILGVVPFGR